MEWLNNLLTILIGTGLRLLVPIAMTVLLVYLLRQLDKHWQATAIREVSPVKKPECWKIKGCSEEKRATCKGANAIEPCWQAFRQKNGYLKDECLNCNVFQQAPALISRI